MRVIAFLILAASAAAQGTLARIEGRVLNSAGEPLSGATLQLLRDAPFTRGGTPTFRPIPTTASDAEGKFAFPDVAPGQYLVNASKGGYVSSRNIQVEVDSNRPEAVVIRLVPQSAITGRVMDEHGDPVEGVQVAAIGEFFTEGRKEWRSFSSARTDDRGVYRISGLARGRYRIAVSRPRNVNSGGITYYPNAMEIEQGEAVRLREGETLSSIDIRTNQSSASGYSIRGVAIAAAGNNIQWGQTLTLRNRDGLNITSPRAGINPDGTFEFRSVMPGRYFVETLFAWSGGGGTSTVWSDVGRSAVTVTNRDMDDVRIQVSAGFKITGTISAPDKLDKLPRITLVDLEGSLAGGDASTQAAVDGSFQLEHVMSGQFVVAVTDLPANTYVQSIKYGDRDVTHAALELPGTTRGALEIVLAANAGSVSGSLTGPGNAIALWPVNTDAGQVREGLRVTTSDEDGKFFFDHLAPGEYRAIAWEGIEQGVAQYAPFIARFADKAVILSLKEAAREEIDVPLVPRAEAEAVLDDLL